MKNRRKITQELLAPVVAKSMSVAEVCRHLGYFALSGGAHCHIGNCIKKFGLDTSHFTSQGWRRGRQFVDERKHWSLVLVVGDRRVSGAVLKRALIASGRAYECAKCLLTEWFGQELILDVDHINGQRWDNRPENLMFLCPNCHRCKTYCKKEEKLEKPKREPKSTELISCACGTLVKRSKTARCHKCAMQVLSRKPSAEILKVLLWEMPSTQIALQFGVSDVAVIKWAKAYGLSKPPRGYWASKRREAI